MTIQSIATSDEPKPPKGGDGPSPPSFVLEPEEAAAFAARLGISIPSLLVHLVGVATPSLPRAPISRFHVAAAGLGASGRVYLGVNLEFQGVPLHHSVHAEQFLVSNASLHREPSLVRLAVSHVPCGHCRQFLHELRSPGNLLLLVASDPLPAFRPLSLLLPRPFGPPDLLPSHSPLLLDPSPHGDLLLPPSPALPPVALAALDGARRSHAPYTACPAGFAVADSDGRVYGGGAYMESAAYNPSLGPVQAGLIAYVAGDGGDFSSLAEAALVEIDGAAVSHEATAKILLEKVAPRCTLTVFRCHPPTN